MLQNVPSLGNQIQPIEGGMVPPSLAVILLGRLVPQMGGKTR